MLVLAMFVTILPESTQAALSGDVTDPFHITIFMQSRRYRIRIELVRLLWAQTYRSSMKIMTQSGQKFVFTLK